MHPITLALAVGSVSLNAMAQIALRKTMLTAGPLPSGVANALGFAFSLLLNSWFLAGMTCYTLSIGIWLIVLGKTEVSLAYPLLSIGYIITAIIGYYFLGENVNLTRIAGIALICFGIVVISRSA
jgi:multidrug transporter EmrE-like cation transporter